MTTLTEGIHQAEFMISEANGMRSREQVTVTISGNAKLPSGQALGKITATGKYIPYSNSASDGSQAIAALLLTPLEDGVNGDFKAAVIARDAEVIGAKLTGTDTPGLADLAALGIVVR